MSDPDHLLKNYIKTLADRQLGFHDPEPLTDEQLREIALNTGMSQAEWEASLTTADQYYQNGRTFNNQRNWPDAIDALSKAVSIYPNHIEALYELSKAWLHQGMASADKAAFERYELYLGFLLKRNPTHPGGLALQTEEHNWQTRTTNLDRFQSKQRNRYLMLGAGFVAVLVLAMHFYISGSMNSKAENVRSAWAQVENVYQRKANLIPQLIEVVKAQANVPAAAVEELRAHSDKALQMRPLEGGSMPNEQTLGAYADAYETNLRSSVATIVAEAGKTPGFAASEQFLDLQTQIEGAENRISVEKKKYNEAVSAYNAKAGQFPFSLYGYEPLSYYHGQTKIAP